MRALKRRLVDLHHLLEKRGAAARVLDGPTAATETLGRWKLALLNRGRAATDILEEVIASGRDEGPGEDHPVHAAITYLQRHSAAADRLHTPGRDSSGWPSAAHHGGDA